MNKMKYFLFCSMILTLILANGPVIAQAASANNDILNQFGNIITVSSTVPSNGDINPYGVAQVTNTAGKLNSGHILVSNFNNSSNLQGTGTTIVDVAPGGPLDLFAKINAGALPGACPGGVGLTTALVVLHSGWVIVGSLPTTDGTAATADSGCLIVLDNMGTPVATISGAPINGPWDMTAIEGDNEAQLFVTNVLNGTVAANGQVVNQGTVVRVNLDLTVSPPSVKSITVIGDGFPERTDPAALVIGPTGVGLSPDCGTGGGDCLLYVADSLSNRIAVIDNPLARTTSDGIGMTLSSGDNLNDPLGLVVAPDGNILTVNGNDGYITEITPQGRQIAKTILDKSGKPHGAGTLFGLGFNPAAGVFFVDDGTNTMNLLH
jgi:hypothetical protein